MLCYFISRKDFTIINCIEASTYSIAYNLNCGGKTSIVIAGNPNASDGDFVILKDGKDIKFKGIIEVIDNADGGKKYSISCLEMEQLFDRQVILQNEGLISNSGIEDFVKYMIERFFSASGDDFIDMNYIKCNVLTHTKVNSKPTAENGIYNLKTYIGNIKEQYGIYLDFEFTKENLNISIYKKEQSSIQIDTTVTDIISCNETYKIKALSKLTVIWLNNVTQEKTLRYFYLHPNRTVSESSENRVDGTISTIFVEAETEDEMIQAAKNEFKSNSYSHSIEANILMTSKLYPLNELYVGHELVIKTAAAGVKESIISEIAFSDDSNAIFVKFGILKVTLTDKLK